MGGYFCLFYFFFSSFPFREAKLPYFLFFFFSFFSISFSFSFLLPPFFSLSFSFNCIRHIPDQYQYHAGPQLYVQQIGPVVGSFHCTRRHATSGTSVRWPVSSSGFGFGRCLSCALSVADPFLFSFIPFLVSPRFEPRLPSDRVHLCISVFLWRDNWNRNYIRPYETLIRLHDDK